MRRSGAYTLSVMLLLAMVFSELPAQSTFVWHQQLRNTSPETQLKAAIRLASFYTIKDPDSSYFFAQQAYQLARSSNHQDGMAESSFLIAKAIVIKSEDYEAAIRWQKKTLFHLEQGGSSDLQKQLIPDTYLGIAITYKRLERYDSAMMYLNRADKSLERSARKEEQWNSHKIKTSLYLDMEEYDKACAEAERAWEGMMAHGASKAQKGFLLYLMANASLLAENSKLYSRSMERIMAIQKSPDPFDLEAQTPTHISLENLIEKKDISPTLLMVTEQAETEGKNFFAGLYATNLGVTYIRQKQPRKALEAYERAKLNYQKAGMSGRVWQSEKALYLLHKELGETEAAFHSLEAASALRDSIKQEQSLARIAELEVKYDTEKKSAALVQRTKERNRWLVSSIVLLILATGIFVLFQNRIRLLQLISQQKQRESEQALHLTSYNAMIEGQEQERKRIAQELHDGVGGALASLKSYSQIRTSKPNLAEEAARKTDQLLDDVSQDVRRISQDLMPVSLERLGLQAALADIASQLKDHGTEASLEFFGEETNLSDQQTLMVYRIVQELCNNVRKHAEASQVLIQLFIGENHFNLLVEDNGKGFDEQAVSEQKSLGLKTLEARVALLGGTIEIDTRAGTGTSVYIETKVL